MTVSHQQQINGSIAISSDNENNLDESLRWIELTYYSTPQPQWTTFKQSTFGSGNVLTNTSAVRKWKLEGRSIANICQPNLSYNNYVIGPICHMLSKEEPIS